MKRSSFAIAWTIVLIALPSIVSAQTDSVRALADSATGVTAPAPLPVTEQPSMSFRTSFDAWAEERADRVSIVVAGTSIWTSCDWLSSNRDYVLFRCQGEDVRLRWSAIKGTATVPNAAVPRGKVIL